MTGVNKQSNAKETKADEVCTNKCPNKKNTFTTECNISLWSFAGLGSLGDSC